MNADMIYNMHQIAHLNQMLTNHVNNVKRMEMERRHEAYNAQQRAAFLQSEYDLMMMRRQEQERLMSQQIQVANASIMSHNESFERQLGYIKTPTPYQGVVEPRVVGEDSLEQGLVSMSEQESIEKESFPPLNPDFHEIDEGQQYRQAYLSEFCDIIDEPLGMNKVPICINPRQAFFPSA